jgi:hypothetical protein
MMKPSSLPDGTPKMHLFGLSFQRYSRKDAKVSSEDDVWFEDRWMVASLCDE